MEVIDPSHLLYVVHATRDHSAEGHQTLAFVFAVAEWCGELRVADPDNLILGACFLRRAQAIEKLERLPWPTMREPILAYLRGEAGRGTVWLYREQPDGANELVARIDGARQ